MNDHNSRSSGEYKLSSSDEDKQSNIASIEENNDFIKQSFISSLHLPFHRSNSSKETKLRSISFQALDMDRLELLSSASSSTGNSDKYKLSSNSNNVSSLSHSSNEAVNIRYIAPQFLVSPTTVSRRSLLGSPANILDDNLPRPRADSYQSSSYQSSRVSSSSGRSSSSNNTGGSSYSVIDDISSESSK